MLAQRLDLYILQIMKYADASIVYIHAKYIEKYSLYNNSTWCVISINIKLSLVKKDHF